MIISELDIYIDTVQSHTYANIVYMEDVTLFPLYLQTFLNIMPNTKHPGIGM